MEALFELADLAARTAAAGQQSAYVRWPRAEHDRRPREVAGRIVGDANEPVTRTVRRAGGRPCRPEARCFSANNYRGTGDRPLCAVLSSSSSPARRWRRPIAIAKAVAVRPLRPLPRSLPCTIPQHCVLPADNLTNIRRRRVSSALSVARAVRRSPIDQSITPASWTYSLGR
jgi:hypothetical protein